MSNLRKVHTENLGTKTAKVYRDSEWQEYRVRLYLNGTLHAAADYFTDDKADAIETAFAMVKPERARPLSVPFNVAVSHIASKVLPLGFDTAAIAPNTLAALTAHHEKTGRLLVWNGAADATIYADKETLFAFRAWHDSKHLLNQFPFSRAGEVAAAAAQCSDIRAIYDGAQADYFCTLIEAEIIGMTDYRARHGAFPLDQIGFVRAYLSNAENPGVTPCPIAAPPRFGLSAAN